MDEEEVELLADHPTTPSENTSEIPPSQVEWQWQEDNAVYNSHLVKEIYDDSNDVTSVNDTDVQKRYKIVTFVYNKSNNQIGLVLEFSGVSDTFTEPFNTDVLSNFMEDMEFLSDAETGGEERFWFSRITEPQF